MCHFVSCVILYRLGLLEGRSEVKRRRRERGQGEVVRGFCEERFPLYIVDDGSCQVFI